MSARTKIAKQLPAILTVLAIVLAVALAFFMKSIFFKDDIQQKKMVQQITVLTPPPPPPPPPEVEQQQEEIEEEVIEEQPDESMPDEGMDEAPGEELGLDSDGSAGSDGFGLVAKKGGRGLLGGGYHTTVQAEIQKILMGDDELKYMEYEAIVKVYISDDGSFERFSIEIIGGDEKAERELERLFSSIQGIGKPRPIEDENNWYTMRFTSSI